ncbi:hypothetical protein JVT61DRAFT_8607 [Boletus reticuloceps]|uniref:Uncharacterized protein n=1 Tax=Boletus reticuloceps TaxID=495285 RepID=A0A8I2Z0L2_9AGAM|nr:hypothetical protein JVT61DRAFT_8607 [Boletus reticuloceps]
MRRAYVKKAQLVLQRAPAAHLILLTHPLYHLLLRVRGNELLQLLPLPRNPCHANAPVAQTLESGGSALYSIAEVDDSDMPVDADSDAPPEVFSFIDSHEGAKEFLSVLGDSTMLSDPEGDLESEDYGREIDAVSSTTNANSGSESSGTDDAFLQSVLPPPPPPAVKKKNDKAKSTSARRGGTSTQARAVESTYDPQTCSFVIQCVVRRPNGTNSPFAIPSQITYDKLRMEVAKKLKCFPGTLRLQYRLDPNNTKHAAMSIQSAQELVLFITRMRPMLVPQRLANGKPSTRPLKNILVYFEDGSSDDELADPPNARSSKSGKGNRTGTKTSTSGTNMAEEGKTPHEENVEQLQKRYTCKVHTKTPDAPVFCYPGPHETCLVLTIGQISFWGREIINGIGTVENKPPTLYLHATRPRTRTQPLAATGSDHQSLLPSHPFNPHGGYPYPPAPPVIVVPPWGLGGTLQGPGYPPQGGNGYFHPPAAQPANTLQVAVRPLTGGPNSSRSTSPTFSNATTHTDATSLCSIDDIPLARIPSISTWLKSLDDHEERGKDEIGFTQFAHIFKQEGFFRISQLSGEFMSRDELQGMLNVPRGIALLIMQYAKQDLRKLASEMLRDASTS